MDDEQRRQAFARVVGQLWRLHGWQVLERDDETLEAVLYHQTSWPTWPLGRGRFRLDPRGRRRTWRKVWMTGDGRVAQRNSTKPMSLADDRQVPPF